MDTAWAVLNDRFRVMAKYAEDVVSPLLEQELARAGSATRSMVRRARRLLCREESLVDDEAKQRISELTAVSPNIKLIYDYKQRLQGVWAKRGGSAEERLKELKQWCVDAEASGIQALKEFVDELKSYSIPKRATATA
jgi:hypothetical protein